MFASLKNKIREETGSDLSKLSAKLTSSTLQRIDSLRGRTHHGSSSSINSLVSSDGFKEDGEDFRRRLLKIETEFAKKLEQKELEFKELLSEKDHKLQSLEKENNCLKESLKAAEEFKQKLVEHQEDNEQIETFQNTELTKVKNLVLLREQELAHKTNALKEVNSQLEKMRSEVNRLRRQEEMLSDVQQNAKTEIKVVKKNLENTEQELDKTENEFTKLKITIDSEHQTNHSLKEIITKLEKELNQEKTNSLNVQKTLTRVTTEKNTALLRNAEISQQMELIKQEKRRQETEINDIYNKYAQLEEENNKYKESKQLEQELKNRVIELEEQIVEKNKNMKTLQLRLADMKKTFKQELNYFNNDSQEYSAAILTPSQNLTRTFGGGGGGAGSGNGGNVRRDDDDVNFKYLKHVVIKFLTSREYEAQQLIKAIATVLKFTPDEEKLVIDTLEWKKSWFGSRPKLIGQKNRLPSSTTS